jgi:DNA polymerase-3 subunit delta'
MGEIPPPSANPVLFGHDAAERTLIEAWASGRLPHGWLIAGPPGIGKATLGYRFARFLLANPAAPEHGLFAAPPPASLALDTDHPVFRRVAAGAHPDLMVLEREIDQKKDRERSVITVEQVRAIGHFLHLTPSEGGRRIVLIDPIDDLNTNATNALLKLLEEPPENAALLLISHAPGGLLPTIRSRCRRLDLRPLRADMVARWLSNVAGDNGEHALAAKLAEGSPGRALGVLEGGVIELYREMIGLIERLEPLALQAFAEKLGRATGAETFARFAELYPWLLAGFARSAAGGEGMPAVLGKEEAVAQGLAERIGLDRLVQVWEKTTRLLSQAASLNLDRKQVVIEAFEGLR